MAKFNNANTNTLNLIGNKRKDEYELGEELLSRPMAAIAISFYFKQIYI